MNSKLTTKFEWLKEKSCKRRPSNNWLDLDKKSINLHWKREAKNNNKIRQHEKKLSLNFPSPFPLSNPFFAQTVAITIVIAVQPSNRQWRMWPALSPPPLTASSKGSGKGDSSWSRKYLAVAVCKSFPQAYADGRLHRQIKTLLISSITPPLPPSPLPHNKVTINNHRRHHHSATALPNALLLPLKLRFHQATASPAKLAAIAMLPPPPPLLPCCQRRATTAYKI